MKKGILNIIIIIRTILYFQINIKLPLENNRSIQMIIWHNWNKNMKINIVRKKINNKNILKNNISLRINLNHNLSNTTMMIRIIQMMIL